MNCPKCGVEVIPGSFFCDNCGYDVSTLAAAPSQTPSEEKPVELVAPPVEPVEPPIEVAPPVEVAPPPAAAERPRFVLKESGEELPLQPGRQTLIGRADPTDNHMPDLDLTPHDKQTGVSRRHALVYEQGGSWCLRDLKSTNFTFLNRQKLTPEQDYVMEDGDEVRFARVSAVFKVL